MLTRPRRKLLGVAALAVSALFLAASASAARADFYEGLSAYERQDFLVARQQLAPLAAEGDRRAQRLMGVMYADGAGGARDLVQAHKWLNLAAAAGDPEAPALRDLVTREMTPAQLQEAQALAAAWRPVFARGAAGTSAGYEPAPVTVVGQPSAETIYAPDPGTAPSREQVRQIQRALKAYGYDVGTIDGVVGPRTAAAIRAYQTDSGLAVDGVASAALLTHLQPGLIAAPSGAATQTPVKQGVWRPKDELNFAYLTAVQEELKKHGYDPGPIDAALGPRTRAAVQRYQTDAGLPVTGEVSLELLNHLKFVQPPVYANQ